MTSSPPVGHSTPARGGSSRTSSLQVDHSTPYENSISYEKFVTNEHVEAENPQKRYYQRIF